MPLIEHSPYSPPWWLRNRHLHTIYPALCRKVPQVTYTRQRLETPDGDFLDLDWSKVGADRLLIAVHGLEGSSRSHYMLGMIRAFNRRGWDGVACNLRGCSGEPNRLLSFYHAGMTGDLHTVISQILAHNSYTRLALVGFSLGGNLVLKYLGERTAALPQALTHAAAVSAPCDLASSARQLAKRSNALYMRNFLHAFHQKIKAKMQQYPGQLSDAHFQAIKNFKAYDDRYTAPLHGFADAEDYWTRCSAKPLLSRIRIPTLLLNALDDPFLADACYPYAIAARSQHLWLETPANGGHVGFVACNPAREYWHETRVAAFIIKGR
ncbi:alpha/beta fold hydrolase [candidate division KSB3 bacterium]|uniref:Alpha/beta fold hydrolase n=1 Tax=candidate division KSB3 bacterium TaxID=2044937 RepID=A0A9D5JYN7_9BACT|nr:alpha/beta fold hydrolase [candidate division KSB3 bacterium]MBD3326227.1 alpha/beta fold hydrolase [candidate division KSB3 bacterium]